MNKCLWRVLLLSVLLLSGAGAVAAPAPGKVVAVVYDNSGSMAEVDPRKKMLGNRWVYANYAMTLLAASLRNEDELIFIPLHDLKNPSGETGTLRTYTGASGLTDAIRALGRQDGAGYLTPYAAIRKAIESLESPSYRGRDLWLVVITDGDFQEDFEAVVKRDAQWLEKNKVNVRFVLIGTDSNEVAQKLTRGVPNTIMLAGEGKAVIRTVEELAEKLNGFGNLPPEGKGNEIIIKPPFPLRRVVVLRQDWVNADLESVYWQDQQLPLAHIRQHSITPRVESRAPVKDLPKMAQVFHLENGNEVLPMNDKPLRLVFGAEVSKLELKILPDVAADYSMRLFDASGKNELKEINGSYRICENKYRLAVSLKDFSGKSLLDKRDDAAKFEIKVRIDGKSLPFEAGKFDQIFDAGAWGSGPVEISSSMEYPGYLHRQSKPLRVEFGGDQCRQDIALKVVSGVDDGNVWRSTLDQVTQAPVARVGVQVNGQPASVEQMQGWHLGLGSYGNLLDIQYEPGAVLLRPQSGCCVWWWRYPGVGEYPVTLSVDTGNSHDVIKGAPSIKFVLEPHASLWDKMRWYACPFALLALMLGILWYFLRLLRKARFGPDSRFETEERPKDEYGGTVRPRTVLLREECSALKRWLWPSRREVASVRGLRFVALAQGDLLVDGRDLLAKHSIPGWVYDRSRADAPRAKDRRQDEATLSDNVVMKIDEGAFVVTMRYRA